MIATLTVALTALSLSACKSSGNGGNNTNNPSGGGGGGGGGKTLVISTDLPMQGESHDASTSTIDAINLYLDQVNHKAGGYTIQLKTYDDSTAAKGAWDEATCANNAQAHVANANEVAVMGTYNSGCAKIEVPVLNAAPMLMVSHANTNPGLTKAWDPGEPDKYYPSGTRNYARVITTNDGQVVKDKFSVLGDNNKVKLLGPDGFTGYPNLDKQAQAQGMYMTFAGLSTSELVKGGGAVKIGRASCRERV